MGSGSGGWWGCISFGKTREKGKKLGRVGGGVWAGKEPASQCARVCQNYPLKLPEESSFTEIAVTAMVADANLQPVKSFLL